MLGFQSGSGISGGSKGGYQYYYNGHDTNGQKTTSQYISNNQITSATMKPIKGKTQISMYTEQGKPFPANSQIITQLKPGHTTISTFETELPENYTNIIEQIYQPPEFGTISFVEGKRKPINYYKYNFN